MTKEKPTENVAVGMTILYLEKPDGTLVPERQISRNEAMRYPTIEIPGQGFYPYRSERDEIEQMQIERGDAKHPWLRIRQKIANS